MKNLLSILVAILLFQSAYGAQEGVLSFTKFKIESDGIGSSGPIIIEGQKNNSGKYKRISIKAFGKVLEIPKNLLNKIPLHQNGIQLSYEAGYKSLGGKTVYIVFHMGFTSGVQQTLSIAVSENGNASIIKN